MAKRASWFARVFGLNGAGHDDDGFASFEHIDGSRLGAGEFHLSDSMRLDDALLADFSETLPAFSRLAVPPRRSQAAPPRHSGRPH